MSGRAGTTEAVWQAGPGSLVLLRGPGLAVSMTGARCTRWRAPDEGPRVSVTFRMDSRAT
jgi:hypothetical protein